MSEKMTTELTCIKCGKKFVRRWLFGDFVNKVVGGNICHKDSNFIISAIYLVVPKDQKWEALVDKWK